MSVILGTAGHIDHGKTALVRALTGIDTDRLKEERERGITIELGFAELRREGLPRFGVVDVPGHEAFVRAMLAGAAGMDVVLLVVAADEGVMPQTREHLAIVRLLGVPELVVAYTKCDLVEPDWLELVEADVDELLDGGPYRAAPRVRTSAVRGEGLDELVARLAEAAARVPRRADEDLVRLPLDRVFTIQGTGTVVTGTLWSGRLAAGDRLRVLPEELEARVRGVQVHGRAEEEARAGDRVAVALTGEGADRERVRRGSTLVAAGDGWAPTWMVTARVRVVEDRAWLLEHQQRVHVHHATAQVLARCALLEGDAPLGPGEEAWVQLRLEEPLVVRGRDRFVLRSYSPVTTIAGGRVAESRPPKRNHLDADTRGRLEAALEGTDDEALAAHLGLAGWAGSRVPELTVRAGLSPARVEEGLLRLEGVGALRAGDQWFAAEIRARAADALTGALAAEHERDPLRTVVPRAALRAALPDWAPAGLADAVLKALEAEGRVVSEEGGVRDPEHRVRLTPEQARVSERLRGIYAEGGLAPPFVEELPEDVARRGDLWSLLHRLEVEGALRKVSDALYVDAGAVAAAEERVRRLLGGRSGLGPADFREALDVSRKHLLPLLNHFDTIGLTLRIGDGRSVESVGAGGSAASADADPGQAERRS